VPSTRRLGARRQRNRPTMLKTAVPTSARRSPNRPIRRAAGILLSNRPRPIRPTIRPEIAWLAPSAVAARAMTGRMAPWPRPKSMDGPKAEMKMVRQENDGLADIEDFLSSPEGLCMGIQTSEDNQDTQPL